MPMAETEAQAQVIQLQGPRKFILAAEEAANGQLVPQGLLVLAVPVRVMVQLPHLQTVQMRHITDVVEEDQVFQVIQGALPHVEEAMDIRV